MSANIRVRAALCLAMSLASTFQPQTDRSIHCQPKRPPLVAPVSLPADADPLVCLVDPTSATTD